MRGSLPAGANGPVSGVQAARWRRRIAVRIGREAVRQTAALISDLPPLTDPGSVALRDYRRGAGCVIVTGLPRAGKSTITSLVAGLMPRAAQVGGDDVNA